MVSTEKKLIVVVGPTAVGKTDLAADLAVKLRTEVVSADSRQFYRELQIGTAKPGPEILGRVKHHFVDSLPITEEYTAGRFEREALELLDQLFRHHDHVVMAGGSGLYVQAVCEGLDAMPEVTAGVREKWNRRVAEEGLEGLRQFVEENDPEFYRQVDRNNPARLVRAAEVIESTGRPFSAFRVQTGREERPFRTIKIGLTTDRQELYERIDRRMDMMIAAGLFEEAERFFSQRHLQALQTVGYQEIFGFLEGHYDREEAVRLLKRNSRRYAKRQLTWFRKDPDITWFDRKDTAAVYSWLRLKGVAV